MYNEDLNNTNVNSNVENEAQNDFSENVNNNDVYQPNMSYEYPNYSESESDEENPNKKGPLFIILIVLIVLIILGLLGFFGYKYFFSKDKEVNIDNIVIEGGNLSPQFSSETAEYTIESINDSFKLICSYKGKKVVTSGCNQSILLSNKTSTTVEIKTKDIDYKFNVIKVNENSPIINDVTGTDVKDWKKSLTLKVDATFKKEQHREAYSFDGGKTWQKENSKEIKNSGNIQVVVRDVEGNLSSVYTKKIEKVDSSSPVIEVSVSNKQIIVTAKDSDSGLIGWIVSKSFVQPSKMDEIKLTKETILKYNASGNGDYYIWVKDKAGNVVSKKVTITASGNSYEDNDVQIDNNDTVEEKISISKDLGNVSYWTNSVTLRVDATTNKSGNLVYSFDDGKTFDANNSKTFTSNQTVKIVVKNNSTGKTAAITEKIEYIDNTNPTCSGISGASTEWTNSDRTISVTCNDNGSGCQESKVTKTFNKTTKTSNITIYDNAGNKSECSVNVYVDKTAPTVVVDKDHRNALQKIYKFQLLVTDNESGIKLESMKYKQRLLKNGIDNLWLNKFDNVKELSASNGLYYSYRFTKETGIYKYFTISVSDNAGNINEFEFATEE